MVISICFSSSLLLHFICFVCCACHFLKKETNLCPRTVLFVLFAGLAQCAELCWQLRGEAGKRQVNGARVALQHNIGLGGVCVVTMYQHAFPPAYVTITLCLNKHATFIFQ